jgi:long-subunit fatty acid transport protein
MSSSYRKPIGRAFAQVLGALGALALYPAAQAADTYVRPEVEARVESHDNYDLRAEDEVSGNGETTGVVADLAAVFGIATQRGETTLRPKVTLQEFSDRDDVADYEAFLDWVSNYRWQRAEFDLVAQYSRRDANNPDAEFDDLDPDDPTTPDTGSIDAGEIRQSYEFRPTFSYKATERMDLGVSLAYDGVRYENQAVATRVDYDYLYGELFGSWAVNLRSDFRAFAFGSNYDANDGINETEAYGAGVGYAYRWSEVVGVSLDVLYEHDDIAYDAFLPEESTSGWGATLSAYRRGEVDKWRFMIGRSFTPNVRGSKSTADQARVQYERMLTQRLKFTGAARYVSDERIGDVGENDGRDNARVDLGLRWMLSPTWYVRGGYSYRWQDRERDPQDADDNVFLLGFGYEALERPTR